VKAFIVVAFIGIVVVLGAALVFLMRDRGSSGRMLNMLRLRVALSATLVALIWFSYYMGWIRPHAY